MSLTLYNTLTKKKEPFKTIEENKVRLYLCGPTVYDYLHIGNFRGAIFYNLLRNWLEHEGYQVTFVYNYTDVDDKIIKRANEEGVSSKEISEKYIAAFEEDFNRLGLKPHDHNPRVTDYIPEIIAFIEDIIKNDKAYVVDGEVFFSIDNFENYGKLSGKKLDELEVGQRVEVDQRKRNPQDFVLWKPSKPDEPNWDSPWGKGRPGWHIECSAMIRAILGDSIDIHGGGIDLIFPHHENEIAQGEGAGCKHYCNYWVHNNFINLNDEKMSKSIGNVVKARDFMDKYHPEILKHVMLSVHYRSMLNIDETRIKDTVAALSRVYKALLKASQVMESGNFKSDQDEPNFLRLLEGQDKKIKKALNDDLNTGELMAAIFEVVRNFNGINFNKKNQVDKAYKTAGAFLSWVQGYGKMLALFQEKPLEFLTTIDDMLLAQKGLNRQEIDELVRRRNKARADKDYSKSDELRDQLNNLGIEVIDGVEGLEWEVRK